LGEQQEGDYFEKEEEKVTREGRTMKRKRTFDDFDEKVFSLRKTTTKR